MEDQYVSQSIRSADNVFDVRSPAFIVIFGRVLHVIALDHSIERIMNVGDSVEYESHGKFQICRIDEEGCHAVINHTTLSGREIQLVIPRKRWLIASNGISQTFKPHYDSLLRSQHHLVREAVQTNLYGENYQSRVTEHDLFQLLFDAYKLCAPRCARLRVRIEYGLLCAEEGRPIPQDCAYDVLDREIHSLLNSQQSENRSSGD